MHWWGNAQLFKGPFSPLDEMDGTWAVGLEGNIPDGPLCFSNGSFLDDDTNVFCCNTLCVSCDIVVWVLARRSCKSSVYGEVLGVFLG